MAVSVTDTITAAQYNGVQSRINTILGAGSGANGYGQAMASGQVVVGNTITAAQFDALRTDLNKANNHQSGANAGVGDIAAGQVIGADTSGAATTEGFNDYDTATSTIETNRYNIDGGNATVEAGITAARTTTWNGTISHIFTVGFTDANARRYFFNSGGEIRFSAALSGQSGAKSNDWSTMLSNMGTITMNYTSTSASGTGTDTVIGNDELTGTYQTIFTRTGSGVYAENDYNIAARYEGTGNKTLRFRIQFRDDDAGDQQAVTDTGTDGAGTAGPAVDESVNGNLSSTIQQLRATGTNVQVVTPAYTNATTLA